MNMDAERIVKELVKKYPGKNIVKNPDNDPTEIVCEVAPAETPDGEGVAVAVIDRSEPHYHKKIKETYKITKGKLTVYRNGHPYRLCEGDKISILPGEVHCAVGDETWVEVLAKPGWNINDHFLAG